MLGRLYGDTLVLPAGACYLGPLVSALVPSYPKYITIRLFVRIRPGVRTESETAGYFLFSRNHCQELSNMERRLCWGCQLQRSFILLLSATSFGGSPARRPATRIATIRLVTSIAASMTCIIECPFHVPTLYAAKPRSRFIRSRARACASAKSRICT